MSLCVEDAPSKFQTKQRCCQGYIDPYKFQLYIYNDGANACFFEKLEGRVSSRVNIDILVAGHITLFAGLILLVSSADGILQQVNFISAALTSWTRSANPSIMSH
eukprot:scaffold161972_cov20-Prasinocladus_malaysianus.AAC.3